MSAQSPRPVPARPRRRTSVCASAWLLALVAGCDGGPSVRGTEPIGTTSGDAGTAADASDLPQPDPTLDGGATRGDDGGAGSTGDGAVQTDGASQGVDDDGSDGPSAEDTSGDPSDTGEETAGSDDDTNASGSTDGSGSTDESGGTTSAELEPVDVSGWTVVQTDSSRELTLPEGTFIEPGGSLVIARDASQPAFEDWWGQTMDGPLVFIDGQNDFPAINGDETFTLLDAMGATVDGPTPALELGGNLQRAETAGDGWAATPASTVGATPGSSQTTQAGTLVIISEVSDAPGNGAYPYEFVELAFVAP